MAIRIVSDSSSDLLSFDGIDYTTVPLKIMFGGKEYVDELGTDCEQMVLDLQKHEGPSTTSCPNVHDWLSAFEGSDEVFGVTISSGLSASYSTAVMAAEQYMESHPGAKVYIFDSKATGPVLRLIIEKVREFANLGKTYDEIKALVTAYQQRIKILYSLESLNNLARNGRVNVHVARIATALNMRMIGHASDEGKVDLIHKCRGEQRALKTIVNEMAVRGFSAGIVHIDHCLNASAAQKMKDLIEKTFPGSTAYVHPTGALCSYYADKGGLIVGYEI